MPSRNRSRPTAPLAAAPPTVLVLALAATGLALAGCGSTPGPAPTDAPGAAAAPRGETWPTAAACALLPGEAARGGDLVLALAGTVEPDHAPLPASDAERTVFANLYETLTRVSCTGELLPGLATGWERRDGGRRWLVSLRPGAVFWDGTPVTAAAVIASWRRNTDLAGLRGQPCPGLWLATAGGLRARSAVELEITLAEAQDDLPRLLAHPGLAVAAVREGWRWPVGSGPCRLSADTDLPRPDLPCRPNLHHPRAPCWRSFRFRIQPGADPRDLLGPGIDLAVIRDRRAAGFYADVPGVRTAPLPWDRIHALLLPPGSPLSSWRALALASDPGTAEAGVAEHAPFDDLVFHGCRPGPCPQLGGPTVGPPALPYAPDPATRALAAYRLVHAAADPDAGALAGRAAAFLGAGLRPHPLDGPPLAAALQAGDAAAFLVTIDACYPSACLTVAALLARADWLQAAAHGAPDACAAGEALQAGGLAVPLSRSRAQLVWQGPLAGLELAHDGAVLVHGLGPARSAELP